jgi:hypothetical protein
VETVAGRRALGAADNIAKALLAKEKEFKPKGRHGAMPRPAAIAKWKVPEGMTCRVHALRRRDRLAATPGAIMGVGDVAML